MNSSLKTVLLILVGILLLVSAIMTAVFHSLRTKAFDNDRDRDRLKSQMRFCMIIMVIVFLSLTVMARYILMRYFLG